MINLYILQNKNLIWIFSVDVVLYCCQYKHLIDKKNLQTINGFET